MVLLYNTCDILKFKNDNTPGLGPEIASGHQVLARCCTCHGWRRYKHAITYTLDLQVLQMNFQNSRVGLDIRLRMEKWHVYKRK